MIFDWPIRKGQIKKLNHIKKGSETIETIDWFKNNIENSSATKVSQNIPSGFSMSTISSFRSIENKHDVYTGKNCMKKFFREHAMKIINFKKKKMKLLTKEQQQSYENEKIRYICIEKF